MRVSTLAAALAVALASTGFDAAAADNRDAEIAELKAQLAALQAKIEELEARTDAQSEVNVETARQLDTLATGSTKVETKGGIKVTSADNKFEASLGGRIHFDAYAFDRDLANTTGTTDFRRARLTLAGKAFGWEYKVEQDFAAGTNLDGLRDLYIARNVLGGKITIGHFKPYRSMEELTSSNEILMMERPFASASGLFNGRQFQQGVGYLRAGSNYTAGLSVFNLRGASGTRNEGVGAAGRVTFAPINTETRTLHFGGWASVEDLNKDSPNVTASVAYAGRRGPSLTIATVTGASGDKVTAYGLEAAGSFGPLFFQGEYVNATFERPLGGDQDVATYYLQGSWLLNGGHKPYKAGTGVFGSPKVADRGLWELTARYDHIENKDVNNLEANAWLIGLNYYVNPNLRFMFNYTQGDNELTGDETGQYALRTQFSF
ncbi:OprO/OprP family phosphate-selective porin [Vulcaniibacterium gelatinicum]|uniref:OprO/OprP family phosphate-selective porin n=1 Tax=Vulcaniibacterium gelatinicum TaxID=2598725 RepID=UPI0015F2DD78|nr:porin [Vulcaniibacterium gelatinicum]